MKTTITIFYIACIVIGFFLLLVDLTPGHVVGRHLDIFLTDPDILGGVILMFFGAFNLGKRL